MMKGPEAGPFPSRKANCSPDLRILPGRWSQWFCRELCRPIHYWSSKWRYSRIRLKVGRNSIVHDKNPTWWHLGKLVQIKNTRVWETQDRIWIVQFMEIHQKKAGPDFHRLKTMVNRSIEQNLRIQNFEARNGNYERKAVVKNPGTRQRQLQFPSRCQ